MTAIENTINIIDERNGSLRVPTEVMNKYDVEINSTKSTVEQIIEEKLKTENICKENAFYIVDLGCVVKKFKQWITNLPRVKPYYAMKCNNNPAIVRTLASLGTNFDCASKAEIQQILGSGISASRIIFANPCKMKHHIEYAKSVNVDMMTFDNIHELEKIHEIYPTSRLVLRIITDDSQSVCKFSTKFGAPLSTCVEILKRAKEIGATIIGVSFHVGSGCMSVNSFLQAIRSAHVVFQEGSKLGFQMNFLDIGGGWPGTDDGNINFPEIAAHIAPLMDELFPPEVEIIAEPGRYFVAQSHTLAVNVFAKRTMVPPNGDKHFLYYVNDGVYQSFNCILFDHVNPKPLVFKPGNRKDTYKCTIFGPTCDSMDCIAKDIMLPELEMGEWLYFKDMGAYTVAAASSFNGFKAHPTHFYIESPVDM